MPCNTAREPHESSECKCLLPVMSPPTFCALYDRVMRVDPGYNRRARLRQSVTKHSRGESTTRGVTISRTLLLTLLAVTIVTTASGAPKAHHRPTVRYFIATAYSVEGTGASGKWSHPGTVAADRD